MQDHLRVYLDSPLYQRASVTMPSYEPDDASSLLAAFEQLQKLVRQATQEQE
jgi:hypothetical protein